MIHTSKSLKEQDTDFENYHYQLEDGEKYQLSEGELGWLNFVQGKYSIYDHIKDNSVFDDKDNLIYTMDTYELSKALNDDGMDFKAAMLSDGTVLQAIFFYSSYELEENE